MAAKVLLEIPLEAKAIDKLVESWQTYASHTRWNRMRATRRLLREVDAAFGTQLAEHVPRMGQPPAKRTTATEAEFLRLYDHADQTMRLLLMLCGGLALRWREALRAAPEHWNQDTHTITLETKGRRFKQFPVPEGLEQTFRYLQRSGSGTFLQRAAGRKINGGALRHRWKKLTKAAGCEHLNPHDLRRTAAVSLYRETKDIIAVKAMLGHSNLNTTAYYLQPHEAKSMDDLRERIKLFDAKGQVQ